MFSAEELEARVWVNCTNGKVTWSKMNPVDQFHFGNLSAKLSKHWKKDEKIIY